MGTRREHSATKLLRPLLWGVGVGTLIGTVLLLIAAAVMATGILPPSAVTPVAMAVIAIMAFAGGFTSAVISRERGLLYGAAVGLALFLLVTVIGLSVLQQLHGGTMLLKAALTIGGGALGGILGVNAKRR